MQFTFRMPFPKLYKLTYSAEVETHKTRTVILQEAWEKHGGEEALRSDDQSEIEIKSITLNGTGQEKGECWKLG